LRLRRTDSGAIGATRDVVLPTQTRQGRYNGIVRLRCVTEPDDAQKILLHRLGITLPRRLRRIDELVPNVVEQTARN
jgi:hypothetical protein